MIKTKFSDKKLKKICSEFNLGEYKSSKYFKEGVVQTNILLRTSKGKFVLRYYENRSENYIRFEVILLKYYSVNIKSLASSHY